MIITTALIALTAMCKQTTCDGITYADNPSSLWIPVSSLRKGISIEMEVEVKKSTLLIGQSKVSLRKLIGVEDWAVKLTDLRRVGFSLEWDDDEKKAGLWLGSDMIVVNLGVKRVHVSLSNQELRAYQGQLLVLWTKVTLNTQTPQGTFSVVDKERVRLSSLFNRIPISFCVQVTGNILVHALPDIPAYPITHGCVQLPQPAAQPFFEWIEIGNEVEIH